MKCLVVKRDDVVESDMDWDEIREHLQAIGKDIAVISFTLSDEVEGKFIEDQGAILFALPDEYQSEQVVRQVPPLEYNDNLNRWLKEVAQEYYPIISGDAVVIGMEYNGMASGGDVGELTTKTFEEYRK
jgi:hypothetical protein